ncbi:hypothetical protein JXD38_06140 [candidate division WOR-3 bacterium]|nr:hypothetical protein [candidate division WOR-3 bacterium]
MSTPRKISKVTRLPEFKRDLARLLKKYGTLEGDLTNFLDYGLKLFHEKGLPTGRIERVAGLGFVEPEVYVAKKVPCQAMKGRGARSGLRIVWAWFADEGRVELVEIYLKGGRQVEDKARLRKLYGEGK